MAYIGFSPSQLAVAPFAVKSFTGDGSTTTFTLDQSVPGANEANVEVFVENVQQSPIDAYTIGGGLNNSLIFSEAPVNGAVIYVIHKGDATYNLQPSTGSVTAATLDPVLRNFTVDNFTGNGSATTFTLTDTPYSANSILVTVDGIVQTATTNYTVSGTTLSFGSSAPDSGAVITVVHMGFSSGNKAVMDGSITPVKLSTGGPYWSTAGNVGIGSTSPSSKLYLVGNGTNPALYIDGVTRDIGWAGNLQFGTWDGTTWSEKLRIDGNGNLGIGTTSPSSQLEIKSAEFTDSVITLENTSSNTTSRVLFKAAGTEYGRISGDSTQVVLQSGNLPIVFRTNSAERMRLDAAGLLTLPYGQIKFPAAQNASADANTLDDYEEGTWTPSLGGNTTYYGQTGTYTKIGNTVHIRGNLHINSIGTGSATTISGLPFTASGDDAISFSYFEVDVSVYWVNLYTQNSNTNLLNRGQTALDGTVNSGLSLYANGKQVVFSGVYRVN